MRNKEISALNSRLAAKDETIAELGEQIDRLELQLDRREPPAQSETSLSGIEPADLLNQFRVRRPKSKADRADMEAVLDLLAELGT